MPAVHCLHLTLFELCISGNQFATSEQQNAQNCSLYMYNIILHLAWGSVVVKALRY